MRNTLLTLLVALLLLPLTAYAQEEYEEVDAPYALEFVRTIHSGSSTHGVVVDNNGYVWINNHHANDPPGLYVVDLEGNHAPFSPITSITVDGTEYPTVEWGRGATIDADGNILITYNHSQLLHIDAETGEGLGAWEGPGSLTQPGVDQDGFVYIGAVSTSPPIRVIDTETWMESFTIPGETAGYLSRATTASLDGYTVVSANLSGSLYIYTTEDLSTYNLTDSTHVPEGDPSSLQFDSDGMLWVTDEGLNAQNPDSSTRSIKVFDLENRTYYTLRHDSLRLQPRGIGFATDGDTRQIVVGSFYVGGYVDVFNLVDPGPVAIDDPETPTQFVLEQNYPNPFNPTTTIRYTLRDAGHVSLRVYNSTGQLVNTLVSGVQPTGSHQATWDGTDANGRTVSSGVYFYSLEMENQRETRAMTFLK